MTLVDDLDRVALGFVRLPPGGVELDEPGAASVGGGRGALGGEECRVSR